MTVELFRADPYKSEFTARVLQRYKQGVVLDQTCFLPQSAESPIGDQGYLEENQVIGVGRTAQGDVLHKFSGETNAQLPAIGDSIRGTLDWRQRYDSMRAHSAQHLLEVALRALYGIQHTSVVNMTKDAVTIEIPIEVEQLDLGRISERISSIIDDDLPMLTKRQPGLPGQWIWHLDGYGHRTCDALHVRSTGEIGGFELKRLDRYDPPIHLQTTVVVPEDSNAGGARSPAKVALGLSSHGGRL